MKALFVVFCLLFSVTPTLAKTSPEYEYDVILVDWGRARTISDNGNWVVTEFGHDSKIWNNQKLVAYLPNKTIFNINNFGMINGVNNIYWGDYPNFFATAKSNHNRNKPFSWNPIFPYDIYINSLNNNGLMIGGTKDQQNQVILRPNEKPLIHKNDGHNCLYFINDAGNQLQVYSADGKNYDMTYLITKKGERINLGSNYYPVDMSNTSNYVIGANTKNGQHTRWDPKNGLIQLNTPTFYVYLNKVNKHGSVVANSDRGGLLWINPQKDPQFVNLNRTVDNSRYIIEDAVDISDDGKILITVYVKIDNQKKPYWRAAAAILIPMGTRNR